MYLLDTDTLTLVHAGHPKVLQAGNTCRRPTSPSASSRGSRCCGGGSNSCSRRPAATNCSGAKHWLHQTEERLAEIVTIPFDVAAAAEFDRLREDRALRKVGRADLLIACIALAHRATLVTAQPPPLPPGRRLGPRRLGGVTPVVSQMVASQFGRLRLSR